MTTSSGDVSAAAASSATAAPSYAELHRLAHAAPAPHPAEDTPPWAGAYTSTCKSCGTEDNHPKKVILTRFGELDANGNVVRHDEFETWHHDCHALATRDEHSAAVVAQSGGAKGHALRVFLHGDPDAGTGGGFVHPEHATANNPAVAGQEA